MAAAYSDMSWVGHICSTDITGTNSLLSVLICYPVNVIIGKETTYFIWITRLKPASCHSRLQLLGLLYSTAWKYLIVQPTYCWVLPFPSFSVVVQEGSWCHYNPKSLSLQEHERVQRTHFMAASLMIRYSIFCTKLTFCPEGGARGKPMKCLKWKWSILWGAWLYHLHFMTYILIFPVR